MGEFVRSRLPDAASFFEGEGLHLVGPGKWRTAACEFHGGSDSLRVNVETGAWVCMAGCGAKGGDVLGYRMQKYGEEFIEAAQALDCWDDGAQQRTFKHRPLGFPARAALEVLRVDALHIAVAGCNLAQGIALTDVDRASLLDAAARIDRVASEVGG
jgi:hypothetical protein